MSESKHTEKQVIAVRDALADCLADTYDCTRVWSAWSYGTMGEDDFSPIAEDDHRLQELSFAALEAAGVPELVGALNKTTSAASNALFVLQELIKNDYCRYGHLENIVESLDKSTDAGYAALAKAGA